MRISADKTDPGYQETKRLGIDRQHVLICVNGDPMRSVITADTAEGMALVQPLDDRGLSPMVGNAPPRRILRGRVDILLVARRDGSWPHPGVPNPAECQDAGPPRLPRPASRE